MKEYAVPISFNSGVVGFCGFKLFNRHPLGGYRVQYDNRYGENWKKRSLECDRSNTELVLTIWTLGNYGWTLTGHIESFIFKKKEEWIASDSVKGSRNIDCNDV